MFILKKNALRVLILILVFLAGYFVHYGVSAMDDYFGKSFFYKRGSYSLPQKVIAEKSSPDGVFNALILKEDSSSAYYFAIEKKAGPRLILDADLVPESGYHNPIFELSWDRTGDEVSIEVDHDFGDNNMLYLFDTRNISWIKQNQ